LNYKSVYLNEVYKFWIPLKKIGPHYSWEGGFPDSSVDKEPAFNSGDLGSIPGSGRSPGEGPTPWPGEFHGLYSP